MARKLSTDYTHLLAKLREGEALCESIGLKHASIYGAAANAIEDLMKLLKPGLSINCASSTLPPEEIAND